MEDPGGTNDDGQHPKHTHNTTPNNLNSLPLNHPLTGRSRAHLRHLPTVPSITSRILARIHRLQHTGSYSNFSQLIGAFTHSTTMATAATPNPSPRPPIPQSPDAPPAACPRQLDPATNVEAWGFVGFSLKAKGSGTCIHRLLTQRLLL